MQITETVTYCRNGDDYFANTPNGQERAICTPAVPLFLGLKESDPLPEKVTVTASNRPFKGSRAIFIKDGVNLGTCYMSSWTLTRHQGRKELPSGLGGFYTYTSDRIRTLFTDEALTKASPTAPLLLYIQFSTVNP